MSVSTCKVNIRGADEIVKIDASDATVCGINQFRAGRLRSVIDFNTFYRPGFHYGGSVVIDLTRYHARDSLGYTTQITCTRCGIRWFIKGKRFLKSQNPWANSPVR